MRFGRALFGWAWLWIATAGVSHADIFVGVAGPMTGPYAQFGAQMRAGAEQAVKDINEADGVLGQQLILYVWDDECDPVIASSVAHKAVREKIVFVAGPFCNGSSTASKIFADNSVPHISLASPIPESLGAGVFYIVPEADVALDAALKFMSEKMPNKKIGVGLSEYLRQFKVYEVIGQFTAVPYESNQTTSLDIIAQSEKLGALLIPENALSNFPTSTIDTFTFSTAVSEVQEIESLGSSEANAYAYYTYAAFQIWAAAASRQSTFDADQVIRAISEGEFATAIGPKSFDASGIVRGGITIAWRKQSQGQTIESGLFICPDCTGGTGCPSGQCGCPLPQGGCAKECCK